MTNTLALAFTLLTNASATNFSYLGTVWTNKVEREVARWDWRSRRIFIEPDYTNAIVIDGREFFIRRRYVTNVTEIITVEEKK